MAENIILILILIDIGKVQYFDKFITRCSFDILLDGSIQKDPIIPVSLSRASPSSLVVEEGSSIACMERSMIRVTSSNVLVP